MLIKARVSAGEREPGERAAGVRRAADLPELARFSRGGGGLRNAAADQREDGGEAAAAGRRST